MVNERRNRIPQPWLWVLAGAALVGVLWFVVAVAPSLLIGSPPKGLSAADELKARNDVRTTLVQALAGLAVAGGLVVTYRTYRQNRAEQDRTYERELYATAVEQLGHEKAPVRLGALYSLERLAQDKPERRQVIVNVICAYLRMPFSPTPPTKPEGKVATDLAERTETRAEINEIGNTWSQERQVRLTAQRILAEHLRDDRAGDERSTDPPGPRFWPGIRLNLADATLIDFELQDGVVADADFRGATFTGAEFIGATFTGDADFRGATFTGRAEFNSTTFADVAWFDRTTFADVAWFGGVTFAVAWFVEATFSGDAVFADATFTGADFSDATFTGHAWFADATFTGAEFIGATFTGRARFGGATFTGRARFRMATFTGDAEFGGATFSGGVSSLSFELSHVLSPDTPHVWPTGWCLGPDGRGGYSVVRADDGLDTGLKPEETRPRGRPGVPEGHDGV